jgi:TfoX/Sxy family transcriptional regulator of competence genes
MAWRKSPPELVELFEASLPNSPRIERRRMFGYPAAFVNGNMFAGLHQDDVLVRLSEKQQQTLMREGGRPWQPHAGRVMKNYLLLPAGGEPTALARWLAHSFAYAASLPERRQKASRPSGKRERTR